MNGTRTWPRSPVLLLVAPRRQSVASPRQMVAAGELSPMQAYRWSRERQAMRPRALQRRAWARRN